MIRLLNVALGLVALWLAVLLLAGELGGWTYMLLFGALACGIAVVVMVIRRQIKLRSSDDRARYQ